MKRILISVLVLWLILLTSCAEAAPAGAPLTYRDTEVPVGVKVNQEFIIAVASNPSSGYMWREEFDEKFVKVTNSTFEFNEEMRGTDAFMEQHFRFKTLRRGKTQVTINMMAPDLTKVRQKVFTVNIK